MEKLPETKWSVRANSATIVNDKLFVVGGLDKNGTSNAVRGLDLNSFEWKQFPDLPSSNMMKGFGSVACNLDGNLVVGSFSYYPKIFLKLILLGCHQSLKFSINVSFIECYL